MAFFVTELSCDTDHHLDLHATLAYHDTNSAQQGQGRFDHYAGRMEVTHFEETGVFITLSGLQGHRPSVSALDPALQGLGDDQFSGPSHEIFLFDADNDDIPNKLDAYVKKTTPDFIERERSNIIKNTLLLASELAESKKVRAFQITRSGISSVTDILFRTPCSSASLNCGSLRTS